MLKNGRFRHFSLILYISDIELLQLLRIYNERITRYVFIVHDKDYYLEDLQNDNGEFVHKKGELEKKHIHLLISFYNNATCSAVKKLFTTSNDKPRVEPVTDMLSMYRYLIHADNPEKAQYSIADLYSNDLDYYEKLLPCGDKKDADQKAIEIVNLIRKNVNPWLIASRYGRDCIIHYKQYEEFAKAIDLWEFSHIEERGKSPKLVQIEPENMEIPFE